MKCGVNMSAIVDFNIKKCYNIPYSSMGYIHKKNAAEFGVPDSDRVQLLRHFE